MFDRLILPLLVLLAVALIAVAMVWPQGSGRPTLPGRSADAAVSHDGRQIR